MKHQENHVLHYSKISAMSLNNKITFNVLTKNRIIHQSSQLLIAFQRT